MSTPYHQFAARIAALQEEGRKFPCGGFAPLPRPEVPEDAPRALIFSPHPDDECIVGGLALRLLREGRRRVINVAVTLGSNRQRRAGRLAELREACAYLGFELVTSAPDGLSAVTAKSRAEQPDAWREKVDVIAGLLRRHRPELIFLPHERDWNGTHIGVHHLVRDALAAAGDAAPCLTVETEFWGAMDDPNLMVELTAEQVGALMAATSFHVGEVQRNPYHLLLPAWMQDNVRRGGEVVGGQGGAAPDFTFATLYRLGRWDGAAWQKLEPARRFWAAGEAWDEVPPPLS
jgi:LmbE family N-acetylglucosaminyl deacetylase